MVGRPGGRGLRAAPRRAGAPHVRARARARATVPLSGEEVFDRAVDEYARSRPGYPDVLLDLLDERIAAGPGRRVLDLGAGTGKLTGSLVARGYEVTAVEPLPGMRARLAADLPGVHVVEGRAERIPLADGAVAAVCVAQAFHWFDTPAALDEIVRVLAPGGLLALLWNLWDLDEPVPALVEQIVGPLETGPIRHPTTANHRFGTWSDALADDARFGPAELRQVRHADRLDAEGAAARVTSMSQVQAAAPAARDAAIEAARAAVARMPGGAASFAYVAEIEIRRRA